MRPIRWVKSSYKDLKTFPREVQRHVGYALHFAQLGLKHPDAKPLKGLSGVMEIVSNFDSDAYRAVYATKIGERIYVLHAFQKKSKHGIATPPRDVELIKQRLKEILILERL